MESSVWGRKKPRQLCVALLRACAKKKDLYEGIKVHADILKKGLLEKSSYVARTLVSMYAKCGALAKAEDVLDGLRVQDVFAWNAIIAGYAQQGKGEAALNCFERMQLTGFSPDEITFTCILKACGSVGALDIGEQIHNEIVRQGLLGKDIVLGTALVGMYAKCGALTKAQEVLAELPVRDSFSWNTLLVGYVQQGQGEDALNCFEQMRRERISPNEVTFTCILRACGSTGAAYKGEEIHDEIARQGLLGKDSVLDNALVDMYVKCGALAKARQVFEGFYVRTIASWNSLIAGYAQHGQDEDVLEFFYQMQQEGISPNALTFICALKACGSIGAVDKGEEIHDEIDRQGLLRNNTVLGTALVDMYAKCGAFAKARQVLEEIPVQDVVSWNALIARYAEHGQGQDVLSCYEQMQGKGLPADEVTFTCILKACSTLGKVDKGEHIHDEIENQGLLGGNIVLGTALVDMYAKCGAFAKARAVLEELPAGNVVLWNALLAGYTQQGQGEEALNCFEHMLRKGLSPDEVTLACALKACGNVGAADKGQQIHDEIVRRGILRDNIVLCTAVVDMYAKCGALAKARGVLKELSGGSTIFWNVLLAGYAQQGQGRNALTCFQQWQRRGFSPDAATFSCLLNACSHSGLVDEGEMYFALMYADFGITPDLDHYACIIDLFGRAGQFDKAIAVTERIPSSDFLAVWSALLGACQKWGDVDVGRWAFEHAVQIDRRDAAAYICMANIYAAASIKRMEKI